MIGQRQGKVEFMSRPDSILDFGLPFQLAFVHILQVNAGARWFLIQTPK
jgi:hypothetical protein